MDNTPLTNFVKVTDRYWRCAFPDAAGIAYLVGQGAKKLVNLAWEKREIPAVGIVEVTLADWEPLPRFAPTLEDRHVRAVLAEAKTAPWPQVYHCMAGENRTGIAIAVICLFILGWDIELVISDMRTHGGVWFDSDEPYVRALTARKAEFL